MAERRWEWIKRRGKRLMKGLGLVAAILLLLLLGALLYLNQIGLPNIVKTPILNELRARGLDVHFKRLRWRLYRGFVAEDINLGRTDRPFGTQLYIDEAELRLDRGALKHFQLVPQALLARGGRLTWQFPSPTNPAPTRLTLDHITADLNFLPGDRWEIRTLQGMFEGSPIQLSGTVTNASHLRRLRVSRDPSRPPRPPTALFDHLEGVIRQIQFRRPPVLSLVINADAKNLHKYDLRIYFETPVASAPWGSFRNVLLSAYLSRAGLTNATIQVSWNLKADSITTTSAHLTDCRGAGSLDLSTSRPYFERAELGIDVLQARTTWGDAGNMRLSLSSSLGPENKRMKTEASLAAENIRSQWGHSARGQLTTRWNHANPFPTGSATSSNAISSTTPSNATNTLSLAGSPPQSPSSPPLESSPPASLAPDPTGLAAYLRLAPAQGQGRIEVSDINSPWGSLRQLTFSTEATLSPSSPSAEPITVTKKLDWLNGIAFSWELQTDGLQSSKLVLPRLALSGNWKSPRLEIDPLDASLYGGSLHLRARMDASSRRLETSTQFDFNVHDLSPLLNTNSVRWLRQFGWQTPPKVEAQASLVLPALDGTPVNWRRDVLPTVHLEGFLQGTNCSFRRVEADSAQTHFILSNGVWNLPDLQAKRPEGRLELEYTAVEETDDYHWVVRSRINPKALRPLLGKGGERALDLFDFAEPPYLEGQIWGRWHALHLLGAQANLVATNVIFRDAPWKGVRSQIFFTNGVLQARQAQVWHDSGTAELPAVIYDVPAHLISFTNCSAHLDPMAVTHAIGPQTEKAMSLYQFKEPPTVQVNGYLSVPKTTNVNMHFAVQGGPFEYWKFHLPLVNGQIYWRGDSLLLTNLTATFYRGLAKGVLSADFSPRKGSDLRFSAYVSNAELRDLMTDVATRTNSLEGNLSGVLEVDYANSSDWNSWQGKGSVRVQKGMLWDIPLFGILSPVLNTIHPGLGRSRFDQGTATYTIENSVIHTKDLQIRSPALRIYYTGSVDFDGRVDAQAEASLFRDTPLLGPIFSFAFSPLTKLFVYKVTGTLGEPKKEPLYIPKPLQMLLSPIKTIKDLLPESNKKAAPAAKPEETPAPKN